MIPDRILIWTTRGYQSIGELSPGDKVISYSEDRHCTEYDTVTSINTEYAQCGLLGIKKMTLHYLMTPEHPVLITDLKTNKLMRVPIEDLLMNNSNRHEAVLGCKPFEPYKRTQDLDDIKWSARLAASSARHKTSARHSDKIWHYIRDINGEESQHWINTFFNWNILQRRTNFQKTIFMHNSFVRDMIYHVAPRAGVTTYWGPHKTKAGIYASAFSVGLPRNEKISSTFQWRADRQDGIIYNISTKNGNFLARYLGGTFLMACNYT